MTPGGQSTASPSSPERPSPGRIDLLLVESHPGAVALVQSMLTSSLSLEFDVRVAGSLREAREVLRVRPPEVVVLDLSLPDSSGIGTLSALRAVGTRVPIVVMTGAEDEDLALHILREGADSFLTKGEARTSLLVRMLWHAIERRQMTESLARSLERAHEVETHDQLTGLPNRASFLERLARRARAAQAGGENLAVVVVDLDRFRRVNDRYGQAEGDVFLRLVAERIRSCLRVDEMFCRVGGDEFAVVISGFRRDIDAARVAGRVVQVFREPIAH